MSSFAAKDDQYSNCVASPVSLTYVSSLVTLVINHSSLPSGIHSIGTSWGIMIVRAATSVVGISPSILVVVARQVLSRLDMSDIGR